MSSITQEKNLESGKTIEREKEGSIINAEAETKVILSYFVLAFLRELAHNLLFSQLPYYLNTLTKSSPSRCHIQSLTSTTSFQKSSKMVPTSSKGCG
jgi:hypothetical protein